MHYPGLIFAKISFEAYHFIFRFGHTDSITSVDALIRERALTSGGRDGTVRLWKIVEESQLIYNGHSGSIDCVRFVNDEHFVSSGDDGLVDLFSPI